MKPMRQKIRIKGWSRRKKLALIRGDWSEISSLADGKSDPSTSSGQTGLRVRATVLKALLAGAESAAPEECCGLLLGCEMIEEARPAANIASDPTRHFEIDPQALVDAHRAARAGGPEVIGYFHSHPAGPAEPSATDRALAAHDGKVWAILGEHDVKFWRDGSERFEPLPYVVEDR